MRSSSGSARARSRRPIPTLRAARSVPLAPHPRVPPAEVADARRRAGGRGRSRRRGRHRVQGRRRRVRHADVVRRARGVHLPEGERRAGAQTGRHELRGGRGGLRRGHAGAGHAAPGRGPGGPADRHLRRVWLARHGGRPARQALRRPRHGRLQHEARRAGPIARRRRGRRLPAGRLHEERPDVRRDHRRRRQVLVPPGPTRAEAGRDLRRDRLGPHSSRRSPWPS